MRLPCAESYPAPIRSIWRFSSARNSAVWREPLLPVLIIFGLCYAYFQYQQVLALQSVLHGAAAAAVALTLAMAIKTGRKCLRGLIPVLLFAAIFVMIPECRPGEDAAC